MKNQSFHLLAVSQRQGAPDLAPFADTYVPKGFRQPGFGDRSRRPAPEERFIEVVHNDRSLGLTLQMISNQLGPKSEEMVKRFAAGLKNSVGGGANQFNASQAIDVATWGAEQALGLAPARSLVAGQGEGEVRFWQVMQELRTLAAEGFAFGVMFGSEQQRLRSVERFASDLLVTGRQEQLEPKPGVFPMLNRYHLGFFAIQGMAPHNYLGFTKVVEGIAAKAREFGADVASEVGEAISALPGQLFSGRTGLNLARAAMIQRLSEFGESLRSNSRMA